MGDTVVRVICDARVEGLVITRILFDDHTCSLDVASFLLDARSQRSWEVACVLLDGHAQSWLERCAELSLVSARRRCDVLMRFCCRTEQARRAYQIPRFPVSS